MHVWRELNRNGKEEKSSGSVLFRPNFNCYSLNACCFNFECCIRIRERISLVFGAMPYGAQKTCIKRKPDEVCITDDDAVVYFHIKTARIFTLCVR